MFRAAQVILLISIFAVASIAFASVPATANRVQSNTDSSVSSEEYEIYSSVIKLLYIQEKTKHVVIEERTFRYDFAVQDDEPWRDKWKDKKKGLSLDDSAGDDYESKNGQKWLLNKDSFKLPVKVTLITDLDLKAIFHGTWGELQWIDYYRKFPDVRGFVMLSRIGFNAARNQALMYVGSRCGPGCGDLHFFLLQKENGAWVIKKDLRKKEYS